MSGEFTGLDPAGLRAAAAKADEVADLASVVRERVVAVIAEGQLDAWPTTALDELQQELTDLATLCRERATAMELAAQGIHFPGMGDATLRDLERSLDDGLGADGMSADVAVELLLLPRPPPLPPGWTPQRVATAAIDGTPRPGLWELFTFQRVPPYHQEDMAAWARDAVNRVFLDRDLAELTAKEQRQELTDSEARQLAGIRAVVQEIAEFEAINDPIDSSRQPPVQLYIYDPAAFGGDGRAALSLGDLDAADHVAWTVPGMGTTMAGMGAGKAINLYTEARWASDDGDSVAVLDWVGYDAPSGGIFDGDVVGVVNRDMAHRGAEILAADVAVFLANRTRPPHLTVAGNSYGSTTSAIAASDHALAADDLVLTGSPGAGRVEDAQDLSTGREHTWVGSAAYDQVTSFGVTGWTDPSAVIVGGLPANVELMGHDPSEDTFNAQRFQAENVDRGAHWNFGDHALYYDPDTESLYNVAAIVAGEYDEVLHAEHRYDPWYQGLQDPERDRQPTTPTHAQP